MQRLSKKDREILNVVSQGGSVLQVCRQFGILPVHLEAVMTRVAKRAASYDVSDNAAVIYERALRRHAENAARSMEGRFIALMDASPNAILVINAMNGLIQQVNQNAAELFGYSPEELVGLSVEQLVPQKFRSVHSAYRIGFLANVRKRSMGYHPPIFAVRRDGSEVEIAVALTASLADEDVLVVCTEFAQWHAFDSSTAEQPAKQ